MGTLSLVLLSGVVVLALGSAQPRAFPEEEDEMCESGQYTRSGECCQLCPPGEGVVRHCGATQTVCAQCLDSETFSESYSTTEHCKPCTECTGLMRMETPCTDSNDAVCVCNYGYFLDPLSGRCEPCTVCPRGEGVDMACMHDHDTICEQCVESSYSEHDSSLDPCLPCTICEETEVQLRNCTPERDAICHGKYTPSLAHPDPPPPQTHPTPPLLSSHHHLSPIPSLPCPALPWSPPQYCHCLLEPSALGKEHTGHPGTKAPSVVANAYSSSSSSTTSSSSLSSSTTKSSPLTTPGEGDPVAAVTRARVTPSG
ncbi:hypothetical protein ACEWY4_003011 [Coilia grayii]|uniref:TNFR-Cys domain-containing protein n=1 Tax=Coilia grayii TaxID=363190 RepID=A0ABD1KQ29_9TELE